MNKYPSYRIINLDKLTYAGNLANLKDIEDKPNYVFVKADICDFEKMIELFSEYKIDGVIHLATTAVHREKNTLWIRAITSITKHIIC